jgi:hypothetical protein
MPGWRFPVIVVDSYDAMCNEILELRHLRHCFFSLVLRHFVVHGGSWGESSKNSEWISHESRRIVTRLQNVIYNNILPSLFLRQYFCFNFLAARESCLAKSGWHEVTRGVLAGKFPSGFTTQPQECGLLSFLKLSFSFLRALNTLQFFADHKWR